MRKWRCSECDSSDLVISMDVKRVYIICGACNDKKWVKRG